MPFGDQTGPLGQGPMTGRGRGYCTGNAAPGRFNAAPGMGMGRGGRGWRNRFRASGTNPVGASAATPAAKPEPEVAELKTALDSLLTAVNRMQQRLEAIEAAQKGA